MTRPLIQIDDQVREMNDKEFKAYEISLEEEQKRIDDAVAKATAKQAVLAKLGLTAEEAAALLA